MDQWTLTVNLLNDLSPPLHPQEYQNFPPNLEKTTNESRYVRIHLSVIFVPEVPRLGITSRSLQVGRKRLYLVVESSL